MTIFHEPVKGCFAERYYLESRASDQLQLLQHRIERDAEVDGNAKEHELGERTAEYEDLIRRGNMMACMHTTNEHGIRIHDDKQCMKCYLKRKARRVMINVHEWPLPTNTTKARAVVFELMCPDSFAAYRDATWKISTSLARLSQKRDEKPYMLLESYGPLRRYCTKFRRNVSLASSTKSFLQTHHGSSIRLPVPLSKVCLPNGMKLEYYDKASSTWTLSEIEPQAFAYHCRATVKKESPFASLVRSPKFSIDSPGPSSAEIVASQTECPPTLSVHEYMAFQTLYAGKVCRWPTMLVELGSCSINFNSEGSSVLMCRLVQEVGPRGKGET